MTQTELPDAGQTQWRSAPCPQCGGSVAWTIVQPYSDKVTCTNTPGGERGRKATCGFTMRRAEWDYLREKPQSADRLRERFGKEPTQKQAPDRSRVDRIIGS